MCSKLFTYSLPFPPVYINRHSGIKDVGNFLRDINFTTTVERTVFCSKVSGLKYTLGGRGHKMAEK